ncbi:MAG: calcium/proton exchanger [Acidobacteriota bacterium]|nr:calcium/proton exchanger [Acidobacteriota bacterium]
MSERRERRATSWWHKVPFRCEVGWLNVLLLALPVAIALHFSGDSPFLTFLFAALAIVPLAGILGDSTEALSEYAGPTVGGILNATMGNATELIIGFFALRAGHIEVVKASLAGSIIGNLLLVLGLAIIVGGWNREHQTFSRVAAGANTTMLFLAVAALVLPAVFDLSVYGNLQHAGARIEQLSLWTSGVLIAIYGVSFIFVLKTHKRLFTPENVDEKGEGAMSPPSISKTRALGSMAVATVLIAYMSEMLVGEIDAVTKTLGWTELFVGVIVVAIVGNAAEHSTAIMMARRNKMDLAFTIAVGSSTQIALFVAPVLVFVSLAMGRPMTLVFNAFEIVAVALSVLVVEIISSDGETNWFEGAQLLALYLMLGVAFYFVPGPGQ